MKSIFLGLICAAVALTATEASASVIPPDQITIVTECGAPVAAYVTTKTGFVKYDGPVQVDFWVKQARQDHFIDAGCSKKKEAARK